MCERCKSRNTPFIYQCYAGPIESVMPITVDDVLTGYAMIGQFRRHEALSKEILNRLPAEIEPALLESAFMELPFFSKPDMENMLHLFSTIIMFIVNEGYIRFRTPELGGNIMHWLDEHISESICLDDVADAVCRSRSTVSHVIKRQFGMSFKQLCTLKRVERFERLVTTDPNLTVAEAAALAGYEDPLYFSRQYKQIRLTTPSSYIRSLRKLNSSQKKQEP
jgi:AraC-like DNA-binding protein